MKFVVDASVAFRMLVSEQWDATITNGSDFLAPDLIVSEVLNARWKLARAAKATPDLEQVFDFLARLRIEPSLTYAPVAAGLAERLQHPVYDCFYIALAQRENAKLLTNDAHLARKLRTHKLGAILA